MEKQSVFGDQYRGTCDRDVCMPGDHGICFLRKNFDGIHTKNIYRLNEVQKPEGMVQPQKVALSMFPMI